MTDAPHLADRRKALGLSQSDLAGLLGVSQAAVSRAENTDRGDKRYALALEALELRKRMSAVIAAAARPTTEQQAAA